MSARTIPAPGSHARRTVLGATVATFAGVLLDGCALGDAKPVTASAGASTAGTGPAASPAGTTAGTTRPSPTLAETNAGTPSAPGPSMPPLRPGPDITQGPQGRPQVALTFHGQGDPAIARAVLAICAKADARVTVFAVGQWAQANPDLIREIAAAGHDVGNHTWSHQAMTTLDAATARSEVARAAQALARCLGHPGRWFRPSGTRFSTPTIRAAAQAAGYPRCISYDVDPEDFADPGAAAVVRRVGQGIHPGAIVSLHLGHPGTVTALPQLLAHLRAASLEPVALSTLLLA
ncbi:MAG: polysaccharide deacetylase family protein [Micrococcales bacterium]|nr:polysaccharide deacetylase family protein [Micrococcales bacterium]